MRSKVNNGAKQLQGKFPTVREEGPISKKRAKLVQAWCPKGRLGKVHSVRIRGFKGRWWQMPMVGIGMCCRPGAKGQAARQAVADYLAAGGRQSQPRRQRRQLGHDAAGPLEEGGSAGAPGDLPG